MTGSRSRFSALLNVATGLAQLTRIYNCVLAALFTLVGAYLSGGVTGGAWVAALVVLLGVAFGNTINDYVDAAADAAAKPQRPIPAGRISRPAAGVVALALALVGLLLSATLGWPAALVCLATLVLSTAYSYYLKATVLLGNALVAVLDATIVLYGGMAVGGPTLAAWLASLLLGLHVFAHEILYTVRDHDGDAGAGLRTVATGLGPTAALGLFRRAALLFVAYALLIGLTGLAPRAYLYTIIPCAVLPTLIALALLRGAPDEQRIKHTLWLLKSVWFLSLLPIVLMT